MRVINYEYDRRSNPVSVTCEDDGETYTFQIIRYANWVRDEGFTGIMEHTEHCSLCGCIVSVSGLYTAYSTGYHYCPECGATMTKSDVQIST